MRGRFLSFILGGIIGAAIGVLYAPKAGKETREELWDWADNYLEQGRENYEAQRERVLKAVDSSREAVYQKSEELKTKVEEAKERLKEQVDQATESAREKVNEAMSKAQEISGKVGKEKEEAKPSS